MVFLKNALLGFNKNALKIFRNDSFASRHISPPDVDNNYVLGSTSSTSCDGRAFSNTGGGTPENRARPL